MSQTDSVSHFEVLILGDGDFSFTKSLLNRLQRSESLPTYRLTTSSFDSQKDIETKYSDSSHILSEVRKACHMTVLHDVDATKIHYNDRIKSICCAHGGYFTDIIFNFPHLGKEDCNAHSSLLAHIMHSAKYFMKEGFSYLTISLAETQGVLWKIKEMGERNGLYLSSVTQVIPEEWPGYILRRHHTGKSFKGRVNQCLFYTFRLQPTNHDDNSVEYPDNILRFLQLYSVASNDAKVIDNLNNIAVTTNLNSNSNEQIAAEEVSLTEQQHRQLSDNMNNTNPSVAVKPSSQAIVSKRKRKINITLEQGHYKRISSTLGMFSEVECSGDNDDDDAGLDGQLMTNNSGNGANVNGWQCGFCDRILKKEEGIKAHIYQQHMSCIETDTAVSNDSNSNSSSSTNTTTEAVSDLTSSNNSNHHLQCDLCDKVANSEDALMQHKRAKHGIFNNIKPSWAKECHTKTNNDESQMHTDGDVGDVVVSSGDYACDICGLRVATESLLQSHIENGFIPESVELVFKCDKCLRLFTSDRAMKQHMNFCFHK